MPLHGHGVSDPGHFHRQVIDATYNPATGGFAGLYAQNNTGANGAASGFNTVAAATGVTVNNAAAQNASSAHNNLQPYITCYMFKRTA